MFGGQVRHDMVNIPGQGCCEAASETSQSSRLPDLSGHLTEGLAGMNLLLDLHHLDGTDHEGPDGAGHDAVPGDVGRGVLTKVPAHDPVHTESDGIGESYGAERGVETTVEPQKLRRNAGFFISERDVRLRQLYYPFLLSHPSHALES